MSAVLDPAPPRTAPFGRTAAVMSTAAVVVLTQLYGAIPLFAPVQAAFDVGIAEVAWVQTAFGIAYAAGFIVWGPAVDRFGPRRVMTSGLIALVVVTGASAFVPTFGWLIVGRVAQGVAAATFAPAAFAYLGARPAPDRRALSVTVLTSSFLASAVVGQVLAQLVSELWGWEWFFWAGAAALVVVTVMVRSVLLPDLPMATAAGAPVRTLLRLLAQRSIILLLVATVMVLGPMIALYTAIGSSGLTDSTGLVVLRASALPAVLWAPFASRWLGGFAAQRRLLVGFLVVAAAAVVAVVLRDSVLGIGAATFALAGAVAVLAPAMIQRLTGLAAEARGSITALYTCFLFLGASIAPALVSSSGAGIVGTGLTSAAAAVLAAGLVLLTRRHDTGGTR
ncbi:MFS transporter [Cellulomonas sp. NPDC089187]|uniref:MFS transporter n=1 Tax=Cellulomonas sp. NPDC089187 TaxID=3154970 RepID=UPI00342A5B85